MKKRFLVYLSLFPPIFLAGQSSDTMIRGVYVGFNYSAAIFPENWQVAPISVQGEQIQRGQIQRSKSVMVKALNKYPEEVFRKNLKAVYFLKNVKFYDVDFGGTNSADAVYLTNQGVSMGYTDQYLEQTFHHEFSSILLRNYPLLLDTNEWKAANRPGFIYNDPENGVGAIRNNQSSQTLDSIFCQRGVLTQYGGSSIENDVNTFAQNLFCPEKNFWTYVDRYTGIRKKTTLLIKFYHRINSIYTEDYFKKMANLDHYADKK